MNWSLTMTIKGKRGSAMSTPQKNSNTKKQAVPGKKHLDKTFFKKNEFAVILLGALVLTVIVFFVFFRSPEPEPEPVVAQKGVSSSFNMLEKRINALEQGLAGKKKETASGIQPQKSKPDIKVLDDRVTRLETAFLVKFESMVDRMNNLEKKISGLTPKTVPVVTPAKPAATSVVPIKKPDTKTAKKTKKEAIFHTVEKGETLYSISKKYNTTVVTLQKLNKLTKNDKIYPGSNIIVR